MPAERSTKRKAGSDGQLSKKVEPCIICGRVLSRASDVSRHMTIHEPHDSKMKLPCPWENCDFSTLQKSNLDTHYRRHTQDKQFHCTDDSGCSFQTCDRSSLLRHRKRFHSYIPGRKTQAGSSSAPTHCQPSAASSSSQAGRSSFSIEPSLESASTLESTLSSSSVLSESPYSLPFEENEATFFSLESESFPLNESAPHIDSFNSYLESLFPAQPPSYDYTQDEINFFNNFLTASEIEQFEFHTGLNGSSGFGLF